MSFAQSCMNNDFSTIWEWLYGQSKELEATAPAQPSPSNPPDDPSHRISDDTLLALEREAEVAVRFQAVRNPDPVVG